jgi:hypothetical protein
MENTTYYKDNYEVNDVENDSTDWHTIHKIITPAYLNAQSLNLKIYIDWKTEIKKEVEDKGKDTDDFKAIP